MRNNSNNDLKKILMEERELKSMMVKLLKQHDLWLKQHHIRLDEHWRHIIRLKEK